MMFSKMFLLVVNLVLEELVKGVSCKVKFNTIITVAVGGAFVICFSENISMVAICKVSLHVKEEM